MILKYIYTVFLGVLLAAFVGVGIAAFYPTPNYPNTDFYPRSLMIEPMNGEVKTDATTAARLSIQDRQMQQINKEFTELSQTYSRNVSIISLAFAIAILLVSLTLVKNLIYIADGVLLGGVITLFYSIVRGFESQDNMFRFLVVSIGLAIALALGYTKFIKSQKLTSSSNANTKNTI